MTSASQRVMHSAIESTFDEQYLQPGSLPVPALFARAATLPVTEEQLREAIPGMEVRTLDCAHFVQMERPQEFNQLLRAFLANLQSMVRSSRGIEG
ncbi:MAG: alpha/beta hydrolase [Chloroflexi bacterium]|nr:MAG: alpha/beta hydrolase [Chloroflexota bacterium]